MQACSSWQSTLIIIIFVYHLLSWIAVLLNSKFSLKAWIWWQFSESCCTNKKIKNIQHFGKWWNVTLSKVNIWKFQGLVKISFIQQQKFILYCHFSSPKEESWILLGLPSCEEFLKYFGFGEYDHLHPVLLVQSHHHPSSLSLYLKVPIGGLRSVS